MVDPVIPAECDGQRLTPDEILRGAVGRLRQALERPIGFGRTLGRDRILVQRADLRRLLAYTPVANTPDEREVEALLPILRKAYACGYTDRPGDRAWRDNADHLTRELRSVLAAISPSEGGGGEEERKSLGYHNMGSGGRCDWTHLREAVSEATCGSRQSAKPFDPTYYQGHQMVEGINYNSLDRIVTAFVDAALSRGGVSLPDREEIARIVNPRAFAAWQSMYDYCIKQRDDEATALHYADSTHGPDKQAALAKADAILALRPSRDKLVEAVNDAVATLAAIRATATSNEWADASDHFHTLCGETIGNLNAALAAIGEGKE